MINQITRSSVATANGIDMAKFKCSIAPKVNSFKKVIFIEQLHSGAFVKGNMTFNILYHIWVLYGIDSISRSVNEL